MSLTLEQQARTLANYFSPGRAFGSVSVPGTVANDLLLGLAQELLRSEALMQEFRDEILPDETVLFIDEWESAVGIPDDCFPGSGSIVERRTHVLVKLASLGVQTAADFEALAALLGVSVTVIAGSVHGTFPYVFPMIFLGDGRAARHTIIVDSPTGAASVFPYTFPITFEESGLSLVECLFRKLKPANVDIKFVDLSA